MLVIYINIKSLTFFCKTAYQTNLQKCVSAVILARAIIYFYLFQCFETDTKSIEYKHTLFAQRRFIKTDTERFITALDVQ